MEEYEVRYTNEASEDLERLIEFILKKQPPDILLANRALEAVELAISQLERFPYNCRKVIANNSYIREIIIPFAGTGYIAMYEIDPVQNIIWILGVRHQREDDYH